jgi:hypothetical protein
MKLPPYIFAEADRPILSTNQMIKLFIIHIPFVIVIFFYYIRNFPKIFIRFRFPTITSIMVKIMKSQKVVIVLAGRYAGRKAVVIKVWT